MSHLINAVHLVTRNAIAVTRQIFVLQVCGDEALVGQHHGSIVMAAQSFHIEMIELVARLRLFKQTNPSPVRLREAWFVVGSVPFAKEALCGHDFFTLHLILAARKRFEFGELTVRREVAVAFARYNRAVRALSIFQNGVRDQAKANLEVVWKTYELGKQTLLDYIAEERRFLEVENELIDAMLENYLANIEILRATNAPELLRK